jgi:hypothetical protein
MKHLRNTAAGPLLCVLPLHEGPMVTRTYPPAAVEVTKYFAGEAILRFS